MGKIVGRIFPRESMSEYKSPTIDEIRESSARALFSVVSIFAGCGGSSMGYCLAGGKVLGANESVNVTRETYAVNHPGVVIMPEEIHRLKGVEVLRRIGLPKGELDILDGSPVYSEKGEVLFSEFARLIVEIAPRVFVSESKDKDIALHYFENLGYRVDYKSLNSADFGVPRKRERLLLIGVREDLGAEPSFPRPTHRNNRIPYEDKKFSISEWLRVTSFPEEFIVTGTPEEQYNQIEDATPPLLMKAIARTVWGDILGPLSEVDVSDRDIVQSGQNGDALKDAAPTSEKEEVKEEEPPAEEDRPDESGNQEAIEF